jgi:hypothetical protein
MIITEMDDKARESRLRRAAIGQGLRLQRSRERMPEASTFGAYWLVSVGNDSGHWRSREVVAGGDFGLNLDEVEAALSEV